AGPGEAGYPCRLVSAPGGSATFVLHLHLVGFREGGGQQPAEGSGGAAGAPVAYPAHGESPGAAADDPLACRGPPAGRVAGFRFGVAAGSSPSRTEAERPGPGRAAG